MTRSFESVHGLQEVSRQFAQRVPIGAHGFSRDLHSLLEGRVVRHELDPALRQLCYKEGITLLKLKLGQQFFRQDQASRISDFLDLEFHGIAPLYGPYNIIIQNVKLALSWACPGGRA